MELTKLRTVNKKKHLTSLTKHTTAALTFSKQFYVSSSISNRKSDLSSSIDHSTQLFNKIKNTQSDLYGSSTTVSNPFDHLLKGKVIKQANHNPINHSYRHSRNTVNYIRLHEYRTESLTKFNENLKLKRMYDIINKVQSNHLLQSQLIKENTIESTNINLFKHNQTYELLNSFTRNHTKYCSHILHQITRENDMLSKLSFELNSLKTEIERLKIRKIKLKVLLDSYFQIKNFLLCVKNKTNDIEKFKHDDYIEHQKDKENRVFASNDYGTKRILIQKKKTKAKFSFDPSMLREKMSIVLKYEPHHCNKPIFNSVDEFKDIIDDLSGNLSSQLNDYKLISDQLITLQNEASETKVHYLKTITSIEVINKEISNKESLLETLKARHDELKRIRNTLPNSYKASLTSVKWKITSIYKETIKELPKCPMPSSNKGMSYILIYLETLELCLNYLIAKHKEYQIKCKDRYNKLKLKIDKDSKIRQAINLKALIQKKTQEKIMKVLNHKMKVLFIPRKKVINKYNMIDKRKEAQSQDSLRKRQYEEDFARSCFED